MIVKEITDLIGNTPLLEIKPEVHGLENINLYAKLELFNPFGSVKDKTAWNILRHDLDQIKQKGQTVIEASSGNTAKAIQMICSLHNIPFKIVTNRIRVREVKQILQLIGTEIEELPGQSQCLDLTDPNDPFFVVEAIMNGDPAKYFHTSQYTNERNIEAHADMTGHEIAADLEQIDYFIGGLGTTGSTRGTGQFLKTKNSSLKNIGVVCSKGGLIPGIRNSDEVQEVGLFHPDFYDSVVEVTTEEAIDNMLTLIRSCGVLAGPTGGAAFTGALQYLKLIDAQLKKKKNAVFLICDRAEWYLSYLQKYRPALFGLAQRNNPINQMAEAELKNAQEIAPDQVEKLLAEDVKPLIIDMRGTLAFKGSHISNSINIPAENLEELCERGLPFSRDQKLILVCPVGDQSKKFAAYFMSKGLQCLSLKGGFIAWRDANKPVEHPLQNGKSPNAYAQVRD